MNCLLADAIASADNIRLAPSLKSQKGTCTCDDYKCFGNFAFM